MLCGDYAAAGKELSQCIVLGDRFGTSFHRGAFLAFVACVRLHEGDLAGAQRAIEEAVRIAVEKDINPGASRLLCGCSLKSGCLRCHRSLMQRKLPRVRQLISRSPASVAAILRGRAWCWGAYCRPKATAQRR